MSDLFWLMGDQMARLVSLPLQGMVARWGVRACHSALLPGRPTWLGMGRPWCRQRTARFTKPSGMVVIGR